MITRNLANLKLILLITVSLITSVSLLAQDSFGPGTSQEVSEVDGIPVIIKHLPNWEQVRGNARLITSNDELRAVLDGRPAIELVEISGGTEAATANYEVGTLLIVEYMTPQAATYANDIFRRHVAELPQEPPVVYRRVGNYGVFVFDARDTAAANALIDQVQYGKTVQWLGEDPFYQQRLERYVAVMSRDVALSTLVWAGAIGGSAILIGIVIGFLFFRFREKTRLARTAYSDAGGLTRLNLDDLSEAGTPEN
ncbi:hypothetical protein BH24ACI3_BH24ACI3_13450 [soil metagenome]